MFSYAASTAPAGPEPFSTESSDNSLAADIVSTQQAFSQMWPLTDSSHRFADWESLPASHPNPVCRPPIVTAEPTGESDSATLSRFSSSHSDGGVVQNDSDICNKVSQHSMMSVPERFQHDQSVLNPATGQPYMHLSNTGSEDLSSETIMLKDVDCPDQYIKSMNLGNPTAGQCQQSFLRRANTEPEPSWTPANLAATLAALRKAGASNTLPTKSHDESSHGSAPSTQRTMSMFHQQVAALPYPVSNVLTQQIMYHTGPGMNNMPLPAPVVPIMAQRTGSCNISGFDDAGNSAARMVLPQLRGPTPPPAEGSAAMVANGNVPQLSEPGGMGGKYMSGTNLVGQGASPFVAASGSNSGTATVLQQQLQMQQQQAMLQQHAMAQHQQHAVMQQQQHHALSQQQLLQQHTLIQQQQQEHQRLVQQQEQHSSAMQLHHHQMQGILPAPGNGLHMPLLVGGGSSEGIPSISPLHLRAAAVERAPWVAGFAPVVNKFDNPACNTLFIGNLGDSVDEGELSLLLSLQPGFKQIKLVRNPRQVSCFVEFTSVEDAVAVHAALQGVLLHSSDRGPIRIQFSKNPFGQRCPPSLAGSGPMSLSSVGMGMRSFFQDSALHSQSTSRQHSESNSSWAATSGAHSTTSNQWEQLLGAGSASMDTWQLDVGGPAGGYLLPSCGSNASQQQQRMQTNRTPPPVVSSALQQHGAGLGALYGSYNSARDYSSVPREGMEPVGMRRVGSHSEGQLYGKGSQGQAQSQSSFADFMPWPPGAAPMTQQREPSPLPSHLGWGGQQQQSRPALGVGGGGMLTEQHQQMLLLQQHTAHQQQLGRSAMSALLQHGPAATAISSQALLSALSWGQAGGWMSGNPDAPR